MRKTLGLILILISVGIFLFSFIFNKTITGNTISIYIGGFDINFLSILSLVFFIGGIFLFVSSESKLEELVVPTGPDDLLRAEKAAKEYKTRESEYVVISGQVPENQRGSKYRESQSGQIYKYLRKNGISSKKNIIIESKARNTKENVLHVIENALNRNIKSIGWVSHPDHLKRIKKDVGEYISEHPEAREIRMEYIGTDRNILQKIGDKSYETIRNRLEKTGLLKYARKIIGRDK